MWNSFMYGWCSAIFCVNHGSSFSIGVCTWCVSPTEHFGDPPRTDTIRFALSSLWLVVKRPCIIKPYYPTTRFLMMLWWLWILLTPKRVASIGSNFLVWQHVGVVNYNAPGFWPAVDTEISPLSHCFPHFVTTQMSLGGNWYTKRSLSFCRLRLLEGNLTKLVIAPSD